jgi:HEAT repeat protein
VRAVVVGGLRPEDGEAVAEALARALGDHDPRVRARGCIVAAHPRAAPGLIAALDHPWRWTRTNAASALGAIGAPEAVEPLIARLGARDRLMRAEAASALGRIGDPRAEAPLRALLARATDPGVRRAAADALAALERPRRARRRLPLRLRGR